MTLQLTIPDMACSACSDTITQAIHTVDPSATVQADPKTKRLVIDTKSSDTEIKQAITNAGYTIA